MAFAGLNYLAIFIAGIASFMFGGAWYGLLSKPWMNAAGLDEETLKASSRRGGTTWLMIVTFLGQLLMSWVLAGLIGHLGPDQVTVRNGIISALFVWAGFVLTTTAVNHGFQRRLGTLTLIDLGHWLGVLLIQGAIIGAFGT
ncbi:MAG: DUF1761 domain-containing protein [Alphaproteobacteria bacterium]|nr:DUF1761 domain-containing protein [Alphaproteobacteria bacterium]